MLILTRKRNEALRIGDNVLITVVEVQGDQVRLGITAPRDIQILRQELYQAVKDSNTQAAGTLKNIDVLLDFKKIKNEAENTK